MAHSIAPAAEALLDKALPVLDHGFVRLVDYMGSDDRIVQAARVSYGDGTKTVREDKGLIDYLLRHKHTSPFEQVVLTFHLKMPIFVARQHIRHRMARLNEISGRYSVMRDEFYVPAADTIRYQSKDNKQGRSHEEVPVELQQRVIELLEAEQRATYAGYEEMLELGLARELARINLGLSLYTEMYWQIDLHNLFHYLRLRIDPHAQYEIRVYGEAMAKAAQAVAPMAYEAFQEHILHGGSFGRTELDIIKTLVHDNLEEFSAILRQEGMRKGREREFLAKLGLTHKDLPEAPVAVEG